ncbi:MAG: hypothetical protein ACLRWQ_10360 [Flavonifractor plautii]
MSTRSQGQPLFLFNVTIQNHGGYTVAGLPGAGCTVSRLARASTPWQSEYLTLANKTDEAFRAAGGLLLQPMGSPPSFLCSATTSPRWSRSFLDLALRRHPGAA